MSLSHALLFGLVQGLTEFLPVSSSAHLAIAALLTQGHISLAFSVLLHTATLLVVCTVYRCDVVALLRAGLRLPFRRTPQDAADRRMLNRLLLSLLPLLPAVLVRDAMEAAASKPWLLALALCGTAMLLCLADRCSKGSKTIAEMTVRDALVIGAVQLLAVMPGLSRSGVTLTAALLCGIRADDAVRYSFLLSLPTVLAASVLECGNLLQTGSEPGIVSACLAGFATAVVSGFLSIRLLKKAVRVGRLKLFALYCAALAVGLFLSECI